MPLNIEQKKAIVADFAAQISGSVSAVAAEYRGLTVSAMTELRTQARETGVYVKIIPNTLARRAVEGTDFACLQQVLVGPIVLFLSREEPSAAAKLVKAFAQKYNALEVKALTLGGDLLAANELNAVASLPTKDEAIAMLMSAMQAPILQFVRTLAEPTAQLARVLAAVRDQKEAA
ncbi:MAG: 50S ribosomal protein L10 [Gammaproteobacteria bacterium RIFCSPHIGHO2_12_FULL_41_15]|nr:MAG: 50S ribosomal protein L10 [Gammaproteobacteria bacterium RIFCSPHIGHO2_12_FULL_41_15]